jgi:hypothetical protein
VIVLWTWESSAPGVAGSGVCEDKGRAQRTASAWMRANGADSGSAAEVRLAAGARTLVPHHEPTGVALRARLGPNGRVRWESARETA